MSKFIQGFRYAFSGFKLIHQSGIRLYVVIPLLINTLLFSAVIFYGANSLNEMINWLMAKWNWLENIEWLIEWLLWPLFIIISLTIVFFLFSIIANLIGAPFNGFLAEAVERKLNGSVEKPSDSSLMVVIPQTFKAEGQKLIYFLVRAVPLLLLFLIPLIQAGAPFIWFLFSAWMLAIEYTDYPMSNHEIVFSEQRSILRENRAMTMGFGVGVMLMTMIPVVNFLAMPVAVIGSTRMFVQQPNLRAKKHNS